MKGFFDNIKYKEHPLMFFIDQDFLDDFHLSPGTNKLVHIQLPQALFVWYDIYMSATPSANWYEIFKNAL